MDRILFIVPYYGKWPVFFREWAYTAGYLEKQNIDFLLVTDLEVEFELASNIHIEKMSFEELKKKIQACFDFKISLESPYKLCDYRPSYGLIFQDEIEGYSFWGHCDVDMFWGNVRKFITDDILEKYDKIQYMGHFVLYRNCKQMNELFCKDGGIYDYRHVYSSPLSFSFDEHPGMMQIVMKHKISNYIENNQADISPRYTRMYISRFDNYKHQILYWHDGSVYRKYMDDNDNIGTDEFMYAHFQRKHPQGLKLWEQNPTPSAFVYRADKFMYIDPGKIDKEIILNMSEYSDDRKDKKENLNYTFKKMKQFLSCSLQEKVIWIKQRKATYMMKKYLFKN